MVCLQITVHSSIVKTDFVHISEQIVSFTAVRARVAQCSSPCSASRRRVSITGLEHLCISVKINNSPSRLPIFELKKQEKLRKVSVTFSQRFNSPLSLPVLNSQIKNLIFKLTNLAIDIKKFNLKH